LKAPSINDIRQELKTLSEKRLAELCLSLAKYKKENKEFLGYLLFDEHRRQDYVSEAKHEIEDLIAEVDIHQNLYYTRKNLRRILRQVNKHCKFMRDAGAAAELRIRFLRSLRDSGIPYRKHLQLENLYEGELRKIKQLVDSVHEDLQADFRSDIRELSEQG
jgi:hypothetical protein